MSYFYRPASYYEPDESEFVAECTLCSRPLREDEVDRLASGETACPDCVNEPDPDDDPDRLTYPGDVRNRAGGY